MKNFSSNFRLQEDPYSFMQGAYILGGATAIGVPFDVWCAAWVVVGSGETTITKMAAEKSGSGTSFA